MSGTDMYGDITDARTALGQLWLPSLSLQLMKNDYAAMTMGANFTMEPRTGATSGAWTKLTEIAIILPVDFFIDENIDGTIHLNVAPAFYAKVSTIGQGVQVRLTDGTTNGTGVAVNLSTYTPGAVTVPTIDIPFEDVPTTGVLVLDIEHIDAGSSVTLTMENTNDDLNSAASRMAVRTTV